jgi:hypothetical protein
MDLLDQEAVDDFRAAMRDVTDTFHQDEVTLRRAAGGEVDLLAGVKPAEDTGEAKPRERGEEIEERYTVTINRQYLADKGLVDGDDSLLITVDDELVIDGRRFTLAAVADRARFRGQALLVILEAVR